METNVTRRTTAFVVQLIDGSTRSAVLAWRWTTRHVVIFTILASVARIAVASDKDNQKGE